MMDAIKILIVVTSHAQMGATPEATGIWMEELTTPYYAFKDAGAEVTVVSIDGGPIPVDPGSMKPAGENDASVERYLADPAFVNVARTTVKLSNVDASKYDAVFLPGGHGTMWDFPASTILTAIVSDRLRNGDVVAAVCHGQAGLVAATLADGSPAIANRRLTSFSDSEERAAGLDDVVPFLLESRLRTLGATFTAAPDFKPFAIRDGNLITGQNPASAVDAARLTLEAVHDARVREAAE